MRFLLFTALLVLTVLLVAHGLFFADQADKAYEEAAKSPTPDFTALIEEYPYSDAARKALQATVERRAALESEGALPNGAKLKELGSELMEKARRGVSPKPPFVMPFTAVLIGLAGLALALILPGTRFRGLALLGLLFGAAAALPGLLPPDDQASLVKKIDAAGTLAANLPRIAQGCCLLAGLTLMFRVRRRPAADA
jgi:hypothetical protein